MEEHYHSKSLGSVRFFVGRTALRCFYRNTYLVQLPLCLFLHPTNVIHTKVHPAVQPTKELPVEISEEPFLLLLRQREMRLMLLKVQQRLINN